MAESLLAHVRALKVAEEGKLHKDIFVPLWGPPNAIILTVKPLDHESIKRITAKADKNKDNTKAAELELTTAAALVVAATIQVKIGDNAPVALHELDPEETNGAETIKALCQRDGDVLTLAAAVMKHSGYSAEAIDEVLAGE